VSARLIEPGSLLADRYLVEDMLVEAGHTESWRAFDQVLARYVVLQVLPSASPYAEPLLAAAKRASRVTDPRILQVLDAVDDGGLTYVVREWVSGQALDVILAEGPLPARRAIWLLRELADALAQAHQLGVAHRRLAPDTVVLTSSSGVKIIGLETLAALSNGAPAERAAAGDPEITASAPIASSDRRASEDDLEYADTLALGRLLYACLTARWPGGESSTLPPAPSVRGQYLRPRQVRAGVPRALDELCDRILSRPSRYGEPLTSAAQVKDSLTHILATDRTSATAAGRALSGAQAGSEEPDAVPPALLRRDDDLPPVLPQDGATISPGNRPRRPTGLIWAAIAVLVVGTMLLAYLTGQHGTSSTDTQTLPRSPSTPVTPAPLRAIPIQGATSFDPYPGSGDENPDLVPLAIDGDPSTAWETLTYFNNPALGGIKAGVGLVLDLGQVRDVSRVIVTLQGSPTSLQLRAAPASDQAQPTHSAHQYRRLASVRDAGTSAVFTLKQPVSTRFVLIWLTSLPPDGAGAYRGRIAEVKVLG
jgi:putative peptidoglycan lipid II flippase